MSDTRYIYIYNNYYVNIKSRIKPLSKTLARENYNYL